MIKKPQDKIEIRRDAPAPMVPGDMFSRLRGEIDRLLENASWPNLGEPMRRSAPPSAMRALFPAWSGLPFVDLVEKADRFELTVELAGLTANDIDLRLSDGTLTVAGQKDAAVDTEEVDYHLSERSFGSIQRTVALPHGIDRDNVSARYENGVLTVTLPKSVDAKALERKIEVAAS